MWIKIFLFSLIFMVPAAKAVSVAEECRSLFEKSHFPELNELALEKILSSWGLSERQKTLLKYASERFKNDPKIENLIEELTHKKDIQWSSDGVSMHVFIEQRDEVLHLAIPNLKSSQNLKYGERPNKVDMTLARVMFAVTTAAGRRILKDPSITLVQIVAQNIVNHKLAEGMHLFGLDVQRMPDLSLFKESYNPQGHVFYSLSLFPKGHYSPSYKELLTKQIYSHRGMAYTIMGNPKERFNALVFRSVMTFVYLGLPLSASLLEVSNDWQLAALKSLLLEKSKDSMTLESRVQDILKNVSDKTTLEEFKRRHQLDYEKLYEMK